jgi:threonine aldolase
MRAVMVAAEVGDDGYGEDPSVRALEERVAALFHHEAALFVPSGVMANQIALQLLVPPGGELLCDADAHVVTYERGAAAAYGGMSSRTWPTVGADLDVDGIAALIRPRGYDAVATSAIAVEQTHNRAGGAVIPWSVLKQLRALATEHGISLHMDGARIWHAHIADQVPLAQYGRLFDTVAVCLSKGLGAPVGSLVISSAERITRARDIRKRLGGSMRQAGILAAAGDYALTHHLDRLRRDHARAARLAAALAPYGVVDPTQVRTNIVLLDLGSWAMDADKLSQVARDHGVLMSVLGPRLGRLVTHRDVNDDGVDRVIRVLTDLLDRSE